MIRIGIDLGGTKAEIAALDAHGTELLRRRIPAPSGEYESALRALFESTLTRRNALGLLSEDVNPVTGELWGNFPQTYSMVGLINSATRLSIPWDQAF